MIDSDPRGAFGSRFAEIKLHLDQAQSGAAVNQQGPSPIELSTLSPNLVPPGDPSKPLRVLGGIIAGAIVRKTVPIYPPKTNCLHVSGTVVMHAVIGKDGHVKSVEATYGADVMRQPNVDAVRQWVYRPFQLHGQPVEVETTITTSVDFGGEGC